MERVFVLIHSMCLFFAVQNELLNYHVTFTIFFSKKEKKRKNVIFTTCLKKKKKCNIYNMFEKSFANCKLKINRKCSCVRK